MRITNAVAAVIVANYLCSVSTAFGQDAVPGEILQRTILIKIGTPEALLSRSNTEESIISLRRDMWSPGCPEFDAVVQVRHLGEWKSYQVKKIIFPASEDVDIAVMEREEPAPQQYSVAVAGEGEGVTLGQQICFLGYPFGDLALTSHFQNQELPFIRCPLSMAATLTPSSCTLTASTIQASLADQLYFGISKSMHIESLVL